MEGGRLGELEEKAEKGEGTRRKSELSDRKNIYTNK